MANPSALEHQPDSPAPAPPCLWSVPAAELAQRMREADEEVERLRLNPGPATPAPVLRDAIAMIVDCMRHQNPELIAPTATRAADLDA